MHLPACLSTALMPACRGWWSVSPGAKVLYARSNNRYLYLYAYTPVCYQGVCQAACGNLYWSGSYNMALEGSSTTYPFFRQDFGSTIPSSFTTNLGCNCFAHLCIVGPCCQCV